MTAPRFARPYEAYNPASGLRGRTYALHDGAAVDAALARLSAAGREWPRLTYSQRASRIDAFADALSGGREPLARLITQEMGKPITQSLAEIDKSVDACRYVVANAEAWMRGRDIELSDARARVIPAPLGTVLAIMPWNYPVWQVVRACLPSWLVGNAVLLKHAPGVPGVAHALESMATQAELTAEAFASLRLSESDAGRVLQDARIAAVSLTGSTGAGRTVAALAGAALKKCVLELGGSDPYVVLDDYPAAQAARIYTAARLQNCGQSCIAAKRFIVPKQRISEFEEALCAEMASFPCGDPEDPSTLLGPMARTDLRDAILDHVAITRSQGARILYDTAENQRAGAWLSPKALTNVTPGMAAFDQEMFGPVAVLIAARDERDALALANQSVYGLGACILANDVERARAIAEAEIHAGMCWVNLAVRSDVRLPFGGVKHSGYGRELGPESIAELANMKTVVVGRAGA